jgi:hypothetical protein
MIMYVWDKYFSDRFGTFTYSTTHSKGTLQHTFGFVVQKDWVISDIVTNIILFSEGKGSIWLLRLCAHARGLAGHLDLGRPPGLDIHTARYLAPLKEYFSPGARGIELHSCWTASGSPEECRAQGNVWPCAQPGGLGERFMQEIARQTGVNVMAGIWKQYAQLGDTTGKKKDFQYQFEGPMVTVFPP